MEEAENTKKKDIYAESLEFHAKEKKGKIGIELLKPLINKHDLSLAYSPGVAAPCNAIHKDPNLAYEYTAKGNMIAVVSNGTAVLGLGNLGALAGKPVMEGKAALFKRFADIDAIDIEVTTEDPETFINVVKHIAVSWGGINLEDIKAPECFVIEKKLKKLLDIPVFHDDQHGTAIIVAAGMINAVQLVGKKLNEIKIVVNGAGAAAIACIELLKSMGVPANNIIVCDTKGVIYKGRKERMNEWKEAHATSTNCRTLSDAMKGADTFIGVSVKGVVSQDMVKSMAKKPIIFALANPDPEIIPEDVRAVRGDAIIATGRSDYDNQINNVMCFPYIFRGALDVRASKINQEMKIAAAHAIAKLAREDVTEEMKLAYKDRVFKFGPNYIIPVPFDSRLIQEVSTAVAKAAMETGVARKKISDFYEYRQLLSSRLNPVGKIVDRFFKKLRTNHKNIIFAEGEEEQVIKAAIEWCSASFGEAILIGREDVVYQNLKRAGTENLKGIKVTNAALSTKTETYINHLYQRLQRKGLTRRDCARLVNRERNIFAAEMLVHEEADGLVTGITRSYLTTLNDIKKVIDKRTDQSLFTLNVLIHKEKVLFIADTEIHEDPNSEELVEIAIQTAEEVSNLGHIPRVAFTSFSNFGNPIRVQGEKIRKAIEILDKRHVKFEYDGEMTANTAINEELLKLYPFCRLTKPANILIMPSLHSADISTKLLQEFSGAKLIGPILCGLTKSVQILEISANVNDLLNSAAIAVSKK